jgi:multiple sugar transport system permease protein
MAVTESRVGRALRWVVLALAALIALLPIYWLAITALKPAAELQSVTPTLYPHDPTTEHFSTLFGPDGFGENIVNSLVVVVASVVIALPLGTLAAYALARTRLLGGSNQGVSLGILAVRMLPPVLIIVPVYLMIVSLDLFDTRLGLIAVYVPLNLPFVIWMMESFIRELPVELEEAAMTDGASRMRALRTVVLPLLGPALATTSILAVIFTYNDFLMALVLTATPRSMTVTAGAATLLGRSGADFGTLAAVGLIGLAPIALFVLFAQRHLVRGLTMGSFR